MLPPHPPPSGKPHVELSSKTRRARCRRRTAFAVNAVTLVEEAGYEAVEAGDASEAIAILERRTDIRVIFTDIHMPGSMDGLRLAHFVRGRWPPIKIIATSGELKPRDHDLPDGGKFIAKPYSSAEVTGTLHELVGEL